MAVRFTGLTPLIRHLPLFNDALHQLERFTVGQYRQLEHVDVIIEDYSQARRMLQVALVARIDGKPYAVSFVSGLEQLFRASQAMQAEVRERRKAWHDWTN